MSSTPEQSGKHTSGPWYWKDMELFARVDGKLHGVLEAEYLHDYDYPECWIEVSKADARLIAAAPDMYRLLELFALDCNEDSWMHRADAWVELKKQIDNPTPGEGDA